LEILDRNIIKMLEVFTIMSEEGHVSTSGEHLFLKAWSPQHYSNLILKHVNPDFSVNGNIVFRSTDGRNIRNYWKAAKIIRLSVNGKTFVFENDFGSYPVPLKRPLLPSPPVPSSDEWIPINAQKLRLKMEKLGIARNPKYPKVSTKSIPFNGKEFEGDHYHKTSTLYQCITIAWRAGKFAHVLVDRGYTFMRVSSKKASFYCAIANFLLE